MSKKHDIIWLNTAISTNDSARERMEELDNLSVLSVVEQTGGRGQRGNSWHSEPGKNLTFSMILKKDGVCVGSADQFCISMAAALSVCRLLGTLGIEAKIKWPNDIYVGDDKICGILIENSLRGPWIQTSIIGIGLNVNQTIFDETLPNPTSVRLITGKETELNGLLEHFIDIFGLYLDGYIRTKKYKELADIYTASLWRLDEVCRFKDLRGNDESAFEGRIRGVTEAGLLRIQCTRGSERCFAFKELACII